MAGATWSRCGASCAGCTSLQCRFIWNLIHRRHVCLTVTWALGRVTRNFLHATVVTGGWNEYWNNSQHKKLTLEKNIFLLVLPGLNEKTFFLLVLPDSNLRPFNHESGTLPLSVLAPHAYFSLAVFSPHMLHVWGGLVYPCSLIHHALEFLVSLGTLRLHGSGWRLWQSSGSGTREQGSPEPAEHQQTEAERGLHQREGALHQHVSEDGWKGWNSVVATL